METGCKYVLRRSRKLCQLLHKLQTNTTVCTGNQNRINIQASSRHHKLQSTFSHQQKFHNLRWTLNFNRNKQTGSNAVCCQEVTVGVFFTRTQIRHSVESVPSVCRLSVTFVHSTQGLEAFGNISSPPCILASLWPLCKILRRSSQGNPSIGCVKLKRSSKIKRFWTCPPLQMIQDTASGTIND